LLKQVEVEGVAMPGCSSGGTAWSSVWWC
jgi:hypothetical protein